MAIKDGWIYQKRNVAEPWALYVVKEYDKRAGKRADCIDFTLYHENIENASHSLSRIGLHYEYVTGYVDEILATISDYAQVTNEDIEQLSQEIQDILMKG